MVKVFVDRPAIMRNYGSGPRIPPLVIARDGEPSEHAYEVQLIGSARVVYRPDVPVRGVQVWIEADDAKAV